MKLTQLELVTVSRNKLKEQSIRWRPVTNAALPYIFIAWHWLNQILYTTPADRVYDFMSHFWDRLQRLVNAKIWPFSKHSEQYQLLRWVESMARPHKITNFKEDWKDGIILCALIEGLAPGVCPRHDLLHPKQEILNLELGLRLAEMHLGIISDLTASDILNMAEGIDNKLQEFVARLRSGCQAHPNSLYKFLVRKERYITVEDVLKSPPTCLAKGMGLMMGNKGQKACFNIYLQNKEFMDIVIEIEGPEGDYCTERITLRSPRKKETLGKDFQHSLTSGRTINIFLEYEMFSKKIAVTYIPPSVGRYKLSIISKGQHIFGSPFTVVIEKESKLSKQKNDTFLNPGLPRQDSEINLFKLPTVSKSTVKLEELQSGKTIKRKLLRSIVFRQYANIILQPDEALPNDLRAWRALCNENGDTHIHCQSALIPYREPACTILAGEIQLNGTETLQHMDCITGYLSNTSSTEFHQEVSTSRKNSDSDVDTAHILDAEYQDSGNMLKEMDNDSNYSSKESLLEITPTAITPIMPIIRVFDVDIHDGSETYTPKINLMENQVENKTVTKYNDAHNFSGSLTHFSYSNNTGWQTVKRVSKELEHQVSQSKIKLEEMNIEIVNLNTVMTEGLGKSNSSMKHKEENESFGPSSSNKTGCISGTASRIPETLINDWANLWNAEGESIVKTRLKEWENITSTCPAGLHPN